jgi:hypothetical protein
MFFHRSQVKNMQNIFFSAFETYERSFFSVSILTITFVCYISRQNLCEILFNNADSKVITLCQKRLYNYVKGAVALAEGWQWSALIF